MMGMQGWRARLHGENAGKGEKQGYRRLKPLVDVSAGNSPASVRRTTWPTRGPRKLNPEPKALFPMWASRTFLIIPKKKRKERKKERNKEKEKEKRERRFSLRIPLLRCGVFLQSHSLNLKQR
jgi:hypothetical protein